MYTSRLLVHEVVSGVLDPYKSSRIRLMTDHVLVPRLFSRNTPLRAETRGWRAFGGLLEDMFPSASGSLPITQGHNKSARHVSHRLRQWNRRIRVQHTSSPFKGERLRDDREAHTSEKH
jgi:hypothetical protein